MPRAHPVLTLAELPVGSTALVTAVGAEHGPALAREGLGPGATVTVDAHAPFGGPLLVGVGRARLAVARSVAATVEVAPSAPAAPPDRPFRP